MNTSTYDHRLRIDLDTPVRQAPVDLPRDVAHLCHHLLDDVHDDCVATLFVFHILCLRTGKGPFTIIVQAEVFREG